MPFISLSCAREKRRGRIERGYAGLGAPNVRVSGMGDLKHIIDENQLEARYDPSKIHAQHNILYDDNERHQVELVEQIGSSLFATTLLVASSWKCRHEDQNLDDNLNLELELKKCFVSFVKGYLDIQNEDRAEQLLNLLHVDFDLTAKQIRLFSTREYVDAAESTERSPKRPIFGLLAKAFGFCTHPTAYVHFAQRGSIDLFAKPGRSIESIRRVYCHSQSDDDDDYSQVQPPRIDTSMMRCSPTWVKGKGWVDRKTNQQHLGSYEGVLPFQQLIRDIYVVTYISWLIKETNPNSFEILSN